jgi:hypothetical protein
VSDEAPEGLVRTRQEAMARALRTHPPCQSEGDAVAQPETPRKISIFQQFNEVFGTDDRIEHEATH